MVVAIFKIKSFLKQKMFFIKNILFYICTVFTSTYFIHLIPALRYGIRKKKL